MPRVASRSSWSWNQTVWQESTRGRVTQAGRPADVTARPASRYVAELVGVNLLLGTATGERSVLLPTGGTVTVAAESGIWAQELDLLSGDLKLGLNDALEAAGESARVERFRFVVGSGSNRG